MRTKRSEFEFTLDPKFIAQEPLQSRDESKLMVIHKETGLIEHKVFTDIKDYFQEEDVMIFNNTRVFPARLVGKKEKTGARIEVFLLRELNKKARLWDVLVDPARKIRVGNKLYFSDKDDEDILVAEVVDNTTSRGRTIRFFYDEEQYKFAEILDRIGKMPIPKYINRDANEFDRERYQTLFASEPGAVAAPTAGLHFSKRLMKQFEINGVDFAEVTLHVGLGTFRGIEVEDLSKHKMDAEYFHIGQDAVDTVVKGQKSNRKICSVGTTSMRAIESAVSATGHLKTAEGWTNKFIYPPHEFSIANAMITNFHLPKSSLMIMVCAFAGTELLKEAYEIAKKENYRFYSYGDAMLII